MEKKQLDGIFRYWQPLAWLITIVFVAGGTFWSVNDLEKTKAEKSELQIIKNDTDQLCRNKADKTHLASVEQSLIDHKARDDERFEYFKSEINKRLDRIENKIDRLTL